MTVTQIEYSTMFNSDYIRFNFHLNVIAERQSVRRINDALGRFYSTLVYGYLSVTLGKDRHIHTVTLGKDRHIHIRIYACVHGH